MARKAFLLCGILFSLLYIAMNVFVAMQYQGYSFASHTVSELSAIDAPTRPLWVPLGIAYNLLVAAFGVGVWQSAGRKKPLRVVGGLLMVSGIIGLGWPPMHQRTVLAAGGGTLTDTLHLVWAAVTSLFFILEIGFAAAAFGRRFRTYSIGTMAILVTFGALVGIEAPNVGNNLPTPRIGIWERINIGVFIVWVIVLAIALLRIGIAKGLAQRGYKVIIPIDCLSSEDAYNEQYAAWHMFKGGPAVVTMNSTLTRSTMVKFAK